MRRILKTAPPPTDFILQTQLPDNPIIGFQTRQGLVEKGFIQQHPNSPSLATMMAAPITSGRRFQSSYTGSWESKLSYPELDYFLFETEKELLLWLAQ